MKYKITFLFLLFLSIICSASEVEDLMQNGNNLYQKNQFEEASKLYERVLNYGYESSELYYNLGNSYFRLGKLGYSILNYEKALKLAPSDEDIIHNLAIANARTIDKIEVLPKLFFIRWFESLVNLFSVNGWLYFLYFLMILLLLTAAAYFVINKIIIQKWAFISGSVILGVFILSLVFFGLRLHQDSQFTNAVIVEQAVTVKASPDVSSNDAFIIHEGLKIQIDDKVSDWYKVRLADGKIGWLRSTEIKII
ncbi:MAG: tetratricopeptide repeat protein [Ignavibacteriales bacterium]|nr:MAG: tetratricopeptide repeat protein [Ignavibacteriales bacterium]